MNPGILLSVHGDGGVPPSRRLVHSGWTSKGDGDASNNDEALGDIARVA